MVTPPMSSGVAARGGVDGTRKRSRPKGEGSDWSSDESVASDQAVISATTTAETLLVTPSPPKRLKLLPVAPSLPAFMISPSRYRPHPNWIALSQSLSSSEKTNGAKEENMTDDPMAVAASATLIASQPSTNNKKVRFAQPHQDLSPARRTDGEDNDDDDDDDDSVIPTAPLSTFGPDQDTALHCAIRHDATEAALTLLGQTGRQPFVAANMLVANAQNAKGATPLMLASQRGQLSLVKILLGEPYHIDPCAHVTKNGSTALLQASHHGHADVCRLLLKHGAAVDKANRNLTTPLMRASQEGHLEVVQVLLKAGARVGAVNHEQMSPLMLASQRGHAKIVQLLLEQGAPMNAATAQNSTSLMLATKRNNVDVVRVLLAAGCETAQSDHRGRTALEIALRRRRSNHHAQQGGEDNSNNNNPAISDELIRLLSKSSEQVRLVRWNQCKKRSFEMAKLYRLLQQERAHVDVRSTPRCLRGGATSGRPTRCVSIHDTETLEAAIRDGRLNLTGSYHHQDPQGTATAALIRTMSLLPAPLMELVAQFIPPPNMWEELLILAQRRLDANVHASILLCWDIIDEILEHGGFLQACDINHVSPPQGFPSWVGWKQSRIRAGIKSRNRKSRDSSDNSANGGDEGDAASDAAVAAAPQGGWVPFQLRNPVRDTLVGLPQLIPSHSLGDAVIAIAQGRPRPQQQQEYQPCYLHILAHGPSSLQNYMIHELGTFPTLVHRLMVSQDLQTLSRRIQGPPGTGNLRNNNNHGTNGFIKFEAPMGRAILNLTREVLHWYRQHRTAALQRRRQQQQRHQQDLDGPTR